MRVRKGGVAGMVAVVVLFVVAAVALALPLATTSGKVALSPDGCVAGNEGGAPGGPACATTGGGLGQNENALAFSPDGRFLYVGPDTSALPFFARASGGALKQAGCAEDATDEQNGLGSGDCGSAASVQAYGVRTVVPGLVVSSSGRYVYALGLGGGQGGTEATFARAADGTLKFVNCIEDATQLAVEKSNGITPECSLWTTGLVQPRAIAVSRDGRNLYIAAGNDVEEIWVGANGAARSVDCIPDEYQPVSPSGKVSCHESAPGLDMASDVVVSPDGRNVYVTGEGSDTVTVFKRSSSGALTPAGCVSSLGSTPNFHCALTVPGLVGPVKLAITPNGRRLYVVSSQAIQVLNRSGTGSLSNGGCLSDGTGKTPDIGGCLAGGLDLASLDAIVISPDGADVYVGANDYQTVLVLAGSGSPHILGCIEGQPPGGPYCAPGSQFTDLGGVESLAVSPNGSQLYVGEASGNNGIAIAIFNRR